MQECNCNNSRLNKVIEIFKVSSHLTILRCSICGGAIAEWIDKVPLLQRSYHKHIRELLK